MFHRLHTHRYRSPELLRLGPEPGPLTVSIAVIAFLLMAIVLAVIILEIVPSVAADSGAYGMSYSREDTKWDIALKL